MLSHVFAAARAGHWSGKVQATSLAAQTRYQRVESDDMDGELSRARRIDALHRLNLLPVLGVLSYAMSAPDVICIGDTYHYKR